jgi:hypothetical protein
MDQVLAARQAHEDMRAAAKKMTDRTKALVGLAMIHARDTEGKSQRTIGETLRIGPKQVREYETAYREWCAKYPDEPLALDDLAIAG